MHAVSSSSSRDVATKDGNTVSSSKAEVHHPVFFKVFSGCCQLSLSMERAGFKAVSVDSHRNKHMPRCQVLILDFEA